MVTETLRSLGRNGLNYIFNNGRLLVGRLEDENQSTEVWLAKTPPSDATEEGSETKGWRLYKSADGSELLRNLSELHPALQAHFVDEISEDFFSKTKEDKILFLPERYEDVVRGRYKYCEHEGGELKAMTSGEMFPRNSVSINDAPQGQGQVQEQKGHQKRKRGSGSPEDSEVEDSAKDKKAKLYADCYDDENEDDDEELPPYVKVEVDAMDQTSTFPQPATPDSQQRSAVQNQSDEQISSSIANLGIAENVGPGGDDPADQKRESLGAAKSDPTTLTASAEDLKRDLLGHSDEWMSYAGSHGLALMGFAVRLRMAAEVDQMLGASRNILQWLNSYCEHIGTMKLTQQQSLVDARGSGIHGDIVQAHECLVERYQEKEKELRVVFEEMKQRIEVLQTGLNFS
jgi:hypothetical protein